MLISTNSSNELRSRILSGKEVFCRGLFLSARWFVLSQVAEKGMHLVILPNQEAAEYCSTDLYNLVEGDTVFYLPASGKSVERSNYKSSLGVQRTSAIGRIVGSTGKELSVIVTYPEALEELIPSEKEIKESILRIKVGDELSHDSITETLGNRGFEKVDFVSAPGQFAIRGSIVDIFSYSFNYPYRISFWGNEVEKIHVFDCNTQLSKSEEQEVEIVSDVVSSGENEGQSITSILPDSTVVWLDSSEMYKESKFYTSLFRFKRVYLEVPLSADADEAVRFSISPQPTFNKNFELLSADIRSRLETGYRVIIYGEKPSQLERVKTILSQNGGLLPEFEPGKNIHSGFIDAEDKVCCYSDHEIFDRFHRASIRRSVEKTEQLTLNDLNSFNIGDYVVHIRRPRPQARRQGPGDRGGEDNL